MFWESDIEVGLGSTQTALGYFLSMLNKGTLGVDNSLSALIGGIAGNKVFVVNAVLFTTSQVSRPIRDYWLAQSLVVSKPLSQDVYSMMRQASDPAQWSKRAHDFFNSHQFDTARFCFERAGDRHSAKRSMAAALNQKAERCQSHMQGRALYLEAAVVYEELGVQVRWGAS